MASCLWLRSPLLLLQYCLFGLRAHVASEMRKGVSKVYGVDARFQCLLNPPGFWVCLKEIAFINCGCRVRSFGCVACVVGLGVRFMKWKCRFASCSSLGFRNLRRCSAGLDATSPGRDASGQGRDAYQEPKGSRYQHSIYLLPKGIPTSTFGAYVRILKPFGLHDPPLVVVSKPHGSSLQDPRCPAMKGQGPGRWPRSSVFCKLQRYFAVAPKVHVSRRALFDAGSWR